MTDRYEAIAMEQFLSALGEHGSATPAFVEPTKHEPNLQWEARECMVFLGNDGGISLRNVINGKKHAKRIAMLPAIVAAIKAGVSQMERDAVRIDAEWGLTRSLDELINDGDLPKALLDTYALLAELGELT